MIQELTKSQLLIIDKSLGLYQAGIEAVIAGIIACKLAEEGDTSYVAYWESQKILLAQVTLLRLLFTKQRDMSDIPPTLRTSD